MDKIQWIKVNRKKKFSGLNSMDKNLVDEIQWMEFSR